MPYAIMRFAKRKGGPASALENHHERQKEKYASNPDIDQERSHLNYRLVEPRLKYYGEIQTRIEQAQNNESLGLDKKDAPNVKSAKKESTGFMSKPVDYCNKRSKSISDKGFVAEYFSSSIAG